MSALEKDGAETIAVSALNQYAYCPRRCALIFMDGEFEGNIHTQRGADEHDVADRTFHVCATEGVRLEYALPVWSVRLGLSGRCDVVEFRPDGTVYPVEYKHGKKQRWLNDDLQLTAQALCLEEMFDRSVSEGAIWLGGTRQRVPVNIDNELREQVLAVAKAIRIARTGPGLPPAVYDRRCQQCSLCDECLPQLVQDRRRAATINGMLFTDRGGVDA